MLRVIASNEPELVTRLHEHANDLEDGIIGRPETFLLIVESDRHFRMWTYGAEDYEIYQMLREATGFVEPEPKCGLLGRFWSWLVGG